MQVLWHWLFEEEQECGYRSRSSLSFWGLLRAGLCFPRAHKSKVDGSS